MKFFLKKNFNSIEQYLIFLLILSYFLPTFYLSFRFEHIILYGVSIYFFFKRVFNKNYYNILLKKKYLVIFIALNLLVILGVLISATRSTLIINEKDFVFSIKKFFSFLSVMDNLIQPVLLIFISTFFLISKEKKKNIGCILFLLISFGALNVLYAFFEFVVIYSDKFCGIRIAIEQSRSCNFIAIIDSVYNAGLYSDVTADFIFKARTDPNLLKLNLSETDRLAAIQAIFYVNSNSVGWISLVNADRLSGIFNMPIQAAIIHGSCIFLTIAFLKYEQDIFKRNKLFKHYIYIIFFLNVLGSIIPASKVTFYCTIPLLIFIYFFFRNEMNFFWKKKLFNYYFCILIIIMIALGAARWNGYNLYWSQVVKILQVPFSETIKTRGISIPEQIINDRARTDAKKRFNIDTAIKYEDYEVSKKNFLQDKFNQNQINDYIVRKQNISESIKINKSRVEQVRELLKKFDNLEYKNSKESYNKISNFNKYTDDNEILFLLHYFTGGRLGIEPPEINLLKKVAPIFGFGPLFHINFDNLHYYLLFNGGYFSLLLFNFGLIFIIFFIFIIKKSTSQNFFSINYLCIFLIFLVASLGAPSYFLNTAVIYFYLPTAIILFTNKTFDEFN